MNYQAIYDRIIAKNRNTPKVKFQTQKHHIIPKSFAKIDQIEDIDGSWNLVNLSLREHFICHLLLARIWKHDKYKGPKMGRSFIMMSTNGKHTSRNYCWLKLNYQTSEETKLKMSESAKIRMNDSALGIKQKISNSLKGKPHSEDRKRKNSEASKGKVHTSETKQKISNFQKGRIKSPEEIRKCSESRKGQIRSAEAKQRMSDAQKGIPKEKYICPICEREIGGLGNLSRHLNSHKEQIITQE